MKIVGNHAFFGDNQVYGKILKCYTGWGIVVEGKDLEVPTFRLLTWAFFGGDGDMQRGGGCI